MKKFKRLMALVAVGMLGTQLIGVGTAFASGTTSCDFGSDDLEVTIGDNDAAILIDEDGLLQCDDNYSGGFSDTSEELAAVDVTSITVEMDEEDSSGNFVIVLSTDETGSDDALSEWPEFGTFDVDITTRLVFDGSEVSSNAGDRIHALVGAKTFSVSGTTGTYSARAIEFADGDDEDTFDASKATVPVYVNDANAVVVGAGDGDDTYKGGSGRDKFDLDIYSGDDLTVYGGGGNDYIEGDDGDDDLRGGDGDDTIDPSSGDDLTMPGTGDDYVKGDSGDDTLSYADVTDGIKWTGDLGSVTDEIATGGGAGDDEITDDPEYLVGSAGNDVIVDSEAEEIYGLGGNDIIKAGWDDGASTSGAYVEGGSGNDLIVSAEYFAGTSAETFLGGAGSDVLRGKGGDDTLSGGPGSDQAWGGGGKDTCGAEVTNRCEFVKKSSL